MNLRIPEDLGSARSCAAAWPAIEEAFEGPVLRRPLEGIYFVGDRADEKRRRHRWASYHRRMNWSSL